MIYLKWSKNQRDLWFFIVDNISIKIISFVLLRLSGYLCSGESFSWEYIGKRLVTAVAHWSVWLIACLSALPKCIPALQLQMVSTLNISYI